MKRFLNDTMHGNRKQLSLEAEKFFDLFPKVNGYIIEQLGERPFSPKGLPNVAILDGIFIALAGRWPRKPADVKDKVQALIAGSQIH